MRRTIIGPCACRVTTINDQVAPRKSAPSSCNTAINYAWVESEISHVCIGSRFEGDLIRRSGRSCRRHGWPGKPAEFEFGISSTVRFNSEGVRSRASSRVLPQP